MAKVVLQAENLTKDYSKRIAVNNVSFKIHEGEIFGFLGANGAGKSTTIKMLTGLTSITNGEAYINGNSITYKFEDAINSVGAMIETPCFYNYLSAYNNLKYFAKLNGITNCNDAIMKVASLVGLQDRIKDKVGSYSLGMKQRLGIAQALIHSPKVLILDEPTNGLDANGIREIRNILKQLAHKNGLCILISSHILGEMENLCDTIGIIDKGELIEIKTLQDIKSSLNSFAGSTFIKCNAPNYAGQIIEEVFRGKVKICGNQVIFNASEQVIAQIIIELTKRKIMIFGAGAVDHSLEDVFLAVINRGKNNTSIT